MSGCVIDSDAGDGIYTPPGDPGPAPAPGSTGSAVRDHLAQPRTFAVVGGGTASVTATRLWGEGPVESATLPVLGGELVVRALPDGQLEVRSLRLEFGDIHLSANSVPPGGLDLMGVVLRADELVAQTTWNDQTALSAADGELLLDWSLKSDDGVLPMTPQRIDAVPVTLDVVPGDGGNLVATLHATRDGAFFVWTGLMELSDLQLTVQAAE